MSVYPENQNGQGLNSVGSLKRNGIGSVTSVDSDRVRKHATYSSASHVGSSTSITIPPGSSIPIASSRNISQVSSMNSLYIPGSTHIQSVRTRPNSGGLQVPSHLTSAVSSMSSLSSAIRSTASLTPSTSEAIGGNIRRRISNFFGTALPAPKMNLPPKEEEKSPQETPQPLYYNQPSIKSKSMRRRSSARRGSTLGVPQLNTILGSGNILGSTKAVDAPTDAGTDVPKPGLGHLNADFKSQESINFDILMDGMKRVLVDAVETVAVDTAHIDPYLRPLAVIGFQSSVFLLDLFIHLFPIAGLYFC